MRPTEAVLVHRATQGDRRAISMLLVDHLEPVLRFARRLTGSAEAAADVLQDTLLSALVHLADYRGEGGFRAWLFSIAHRIVLMARRRPRTEELAETTVGVAPGMPGFDAQNPEAEASRREQTALLQKAFESLKAIDQRVIYLHDVQGLSGSATAAALGVSMSAMKAREHRARLRLASAGRRRGLTNPPVLAPSI